MKPYATPNLLVMKNSYIILNDGITIILIYRKGLKLSKTSSHPKLPSAADHRQLTFRLQHWIPRKHTDCTPIELTLCKTKIKIHNQAQVILSRRRVEPLTVSDDLRCQLRASGKWIVNGEHGAKGRR